jgi:NAD(P)-dependent dehydrogenase (short-subunit alcohol dehydrogenase family)
MSAPLEGRVAIVTGSSRGIGAAIVQRLAADGARVIVNYFNHKEAADNVVNAINSSRDGAAIAVNADASTIAGGEKLLEECMRAFGRLDILVLNAGVNVESPISQVDHSIFDATFNLHVKGPLFLTKLAAPQLAEGTQNPLRLLRNRHSLIRHDRGPYYLHLVLYHKEVHRYALQPRTGILQRCPRPNSSYPCQRARCPFHYRQHCIPRSYRYRPPSRRSV